MNQLSWMLYLADVSQSLGGFFKFLTFMTAIGFIVWIVTGFSVQYERIEEQLWRIWRKVGFVLAPTFIICFIINALIPSKETVYDIAASEMGEQVLKTPLAGKAEKALESWLDRQISPATTETK